MQKTSHFTLFQYIEIRFADPVTSIGIGEKYIVIGTIMGRIIAFSIIDKQTIQLTELSKENIIGVHFDNPNTFTVGIGDEEYVKYRLSIDDTGHIIPESIRFRNYENELTHKNYCDSSFTLLSSKNLIIVNMLMPNETNLFIQTTTTNIKMKDINTNASTEYAVSTTNYSVPHDFDNFRYAWVEFLSEKERNICVYTFDQLNKWSYLIDKNFGHISHLKLLPNNKLFLVRNLNQCEIREISADFKILNSFIHIGDEVIAVDIYLNSSKIILHGENAVQNIKIKNKAVYSSEEYLKIPVKNNQNNMDVPVQDISVEDENISIVLLDIDGNVNIWENFQITKIFNMYNIKEIDKDYKEKQFFSMGYPYFIKYNQSYFAISSDHGVFVIKQNY